LAAQNASITGRVVDASGALVPGARVAATSAASGVETATETNDEGYYNIPSLLPGTYDVTAAKAGFQTLRQTGLVLAVQQVARVDLTLRVGQLSEAIEVRAEGVVLESETATLGQVVQSKQITELPLLGRNTYALAMLVPGVRPSGGVNNVVVDQISTVSYSINGQRANANEFLLDGAPNSAASQNQPVINANPDMVQEFKVETNGYSAEFGRAAGGVFSVVTRSGSNSPHFTLYEFFRNDKLNANDFFANSTGKSKPPFKFNQFGGTFGGPVFIPKLYDGRNRTFFFFSTEIVRFVQGITFTGTVPRPEQLAGDFSNLRNAAGNPITIYDPLSTEPNPAGGFRRTPFPGNRIPANRIDPIAAKLIPFFPAPNTAGNPLTGVNNYARTDGNRVNKNTVSYRGDHHFNANNRLFARYSADDSPFTRAAPYGRDNPASPGTGAQIFGRRNTVVEDTHIFGPTFLMTLRYSYTRLSNFREPFSNGFDLTTLGFPQSFAAQVEPRAFPNIGITGFSVDASIPNIVVGGALGATDIIVLGDDTHAAQALFSKTVSSHSLRFGGEHRAIRFNNRQGGANSPVFSFNPAFTQGPNPAQSSAAAGFGLASFLLGMPASGSVSPPAAVAQLSRYYAVFFQDNWKITNRLTLNAGLRWEYESPRTDRFDQLTNFDFRRTPPLNAPDLDLRGTLAFVNTEGLPRLSADPDRNNFSPRVGVAWTVTPKTVVRAGAGLFYASLTGVGTGSAGFGISGFQTNTSMLTSLDGFTPFHTLSDPYPNGLNRPTGSSLGPATLLGQPVMFFNRGNRLPYSGQWNLNIQRELAGSVVFEVGYMGTRGNRLSNTREYNQLPVSALSMGDALRQQVTNPFFGQIEVGPLSQRTVARAQLLRPYPHFQAVQSQNENWASSSYHALSAKFEKRYSRGLTVLGAYTFSKMMDYGTGPFAGEDLGGGNSAFQDWNNLAAEWSPSTLDQTHRLTVASVYELPFLREQKGFAGKLFGGWEISGIVSLFGGGPLGITSAVNNTFSQGGGQRPNWTGQSAKLDDPRPERWFDTSQFSNPPAYTFGSSPRTFNGLRSDGTRQLDLSLLKTTNLTEQLRLQFRAESFNVTNTVRFAPPSISFGNPQFGVVSSMGNQPRVLQFALKLIY
jgi:outer membrane receptor protein involved in Fe transport